MVSNIVFVSPLPVEMIQVAHYSDHWSNAETRKRVTKTTWLKNPHLNHHGTWDGQQPKAYIYILVGSFLFKFNVLEASRCADCAKNLHKDIHWKSHDVSSGRFWRSSSGDFTLRGWRVLEGFGIERVSIFSSEQWKNCLVELDSPMFPLGDDSIIAGHGNLYVPVLNNQ